jgi:hypothetical protein
MKRVRIAVSWRAQMCNARMFVEDGGWAVVKYLCHWTGAFDFWRGGFGALINPCPSLRWLSGRLIHLTSWLGQT